MRTKIIAVLCLMAGGWMPVLFAQSPSPAPQIPDAPTVPDAPRVPLAPSVGAVSGATVNQVVYTGQLPTVQELTDAAAAKGSTITRVEENESEILATYRFAHGQVSVIAYRLLPAAGATAMVASPRVTNAPPPVVYVPRPRVVYYDSYRSYDPWFWYPSVAFGIGLGHNHGHHHWGHGGRFRHGGGFPHRGHYRHR